MTDSRNNWSRIRKLWSWIIYKDSSLNKYTGIVRYDLFILELIDICTLETVKHQEQRKHIQLLKDIFKYLQAIFIMSFWSNFWCY